MPALYGWGARQLWSQFGGAAAITAFSLAMAAAACAPLRRLGWLRVLSPEEGEGEDVTTHGERAYER